MANMSTNQEVVEDAKQHLISTKDECDELTSEPLHPVNRYLSGFINTNNCRISFLWLALAIIFEAGQVVIMSSASKLWGAGEALFIRSCFLLALIVFVSWNKKEAHGLTEIMICLLNGLSDILFIYFAGLAATFIWIGDVTAISFNQPVPASVLACIILGETMDVFDGILTITNAIGLVLVAQPSFLRPNPNDAIDESSPQQQMIGILLAFGSLMGNVISSLCCRSMKYRNAEDVPLLLSVSGMIGVCVSICSAFASSQWVLPDTLHDWLLVVALGVCSLCAYGCYVKSLEKENVLLVSVFLTFSIPLNFLFDFLVLSRPVELIALGGVLLIVGSTFAMYFKSVCKVNSY